MNERILSDLEWLKEELQDLTKEERCLILEEYIKSVGDYKVGMEEYSVFIKVLNKLEEG